MYDRNQLKKYLTVRNYRAIAEMLAKETLDVDRVSAALVEDVIHSGMLILQRDKHQDRDNREKLNDVIGSFVEHSGSEETKTLYSKHVSDVAVLDRCFSEIRVVLSKSPIGKRTAAEQVWAAIERFVEEVRILHDLMNKAFLEQGKLGPVLFYDSQSAGLTGDRGKPINPDAAVAGMARQLALTVTKLAFENDWFEGKQIILPPKIAAGEELQYESGINSLLAFCWTEIEDASEELRYWGGTIVEQARKVAAPDGKEFEANVVEFRSDLTHYIWEVIARRRFHQLVFKGSTELHASHRLSQRVRDPRKHLVKPLPEEFVSISECVVHMVLEFVYHLKVSNRTEDYKGLTLAEWVRGYSILAIFADAGLGEPFQGLLELDRDEFEAVFKRAGFTAQRTARFIDSVTYQRGKRDLYDAPLLKDTNGVLYFLAPLFAGVSLSEVVASQVGSLGATFENKGTDFEFYVRSLFDDRGIKAAGFTYEAEGRDFQCDLAVLWDRHLFVFECKNDFLPAARPMLSYYFWNDMSSAAAQIKRIVDHFSSDRGIVKTHLGSDDWVDIYPIVLNAMPFSLPGDIDGVYFYDASALKRFLNEGSVGIVESVPTSSFPILMKKPISKLWEGEEPTANDLIRQLKNSVQLSDYQKRMYADLVKIGISENLVIATPTLRSEPFSLDAVLGANGFSEADVAAFKDDIGSRIECAIEDSESGQPERNEE